MAEPMIWKLVPIALLLSAVALAYRYPQSHHLIKAGLAFSAAAIILWNISNG
jgi:uncharacterized membrane protein YhhN